MFSIFKSRIVFLKYLSHASRLICLIDFDTEWPNLRQLSGFEAQFILRFSHKTREVQVCENIINPYKQEFGYKFFSVPS